MDETTDLDQQIEQIRHTIETNRKPLWEHVNDSHVSNARFGDLCNVWSSFQHIEEDPNIRRIIQLYPDCFTSHFPSPLNSSDYTIMMYNRRPIVIDRSNSGGVFCGRKNASGSNTIQSISSESSAKDDQTNKTSSITKERQTSS